MPLTIKKVDQFKTILILHFDCVNKNSIAEMCEVYTKSRTSSGAAKHAVGKLPFTNSILLDGLGKPRLHIVFQ